MKEFRIVVQNGKAQPYSLWTFQTYEACYLKLIELINDKKKSVKNEYYVINDFWKNEFDPFYADITKYKVEVREVKEWQTFGKKIKYNHNDNKVINLF